MNIELSGIEVLYSFLSIFMALVLLIAFMKKWYKIKSIDVFKQIGYNFRFGLMTVLAFVLLSFSWTTYDNVQYEADIEIFDDLLPIDVPPTPKPPPPPPPPPPPVIEPVPDELIPEDEEPDFVDQTVDEDDVVEEAPIEIPEEEIVAPPPPPPVVEVEVDEIIDIAEQMPRFPGCEKIQGGNEEKKACASKKLLEYIYSNLKYPRIALETGIEGTVVIQFVVNKEGVITDAKAVRAIGGGLEAAALKVVDDMNMLPERWTPGKQRGRNVSVKYTLPIKFKQLK